MRSAEIIRKTGETDIKVKLDLDGKGEGTIATGVGFLDHMLNLFARHGRFNLDVSCKGDTYVDDHHSVEDIGIAMGQALKQALGDKRGIKRYGDIILPMDEALIMCAVDVSGRGMLVFDADFKAEKIGTFDVELVQEFFIALADNAGLTLHIREITGRNCHHIAEGMFKACARALRSAVSIDAEAKDEIPSTKGVLA